MNYKILAQSKKEKCIAVRRYLHQYPELSFQEEKTAQYIYDYLKKIGIKDIKQNVGGRGVVATIRGGKPGKTIAVRADFDALPIQDLKEVEYKSTVENVMHACGHDGHTASLLMTCEILQENIDLVEGTFVAIFQHAEEVAPGGAIDMINDGCLNGVDYIFGSHLASNLPVNTIAVSKNEMYAAADMFFIEVSGDDVIATASDLILQAQTIVSRNASPTEKIVVTFGKFTGDNAKVSLNGTVRTFNTQMQQLAIDKLQLLVNSLSEESGNQMTFKYVKGYPPLINHQTASAALRTRSEKLGYHVIELEPKMGGEDYARYLNVVPGCYINTGCGNETYASHPHHNAYFDMVEDALLVNVEIFISLAFDQSFLASIVWDGDR